jgi:hypothetical protein
MKTIVNFSAFCDAFRDMGRNDNFSYAGKRALFDYLEEVTDGEYELDVIALCCEYYEQDLDGIISDYSIDVYSYGVDVSDAISDDEKADIVEEYLQDNTCLVARIGTDFVYAAF